ncbi:hypothetical protein [Ruegeria atlantica]|uniref:hypothetical protein n=1 Tax=Ruegeria atlantica TaxID=81569 RepID=UPI0024947498|nr:hypothetical protein [Ruegeria atlantica]
MTDLNCQKKQAESWNPAPQAKGLFFYFHVRPKPKYFETNIGGAAVSIQNQGLTLTAVFSPTPNNHLSRSSDRIAQQKGRLRPKGALETGKEVDSSHLATNGQYKERSVFGENPNPMKALGETVQSMQCCSGEYPAKTNTSEDIMLKRIWAKITGKPVQRRPQDFYCLTPYLQNLEPIENPRTRTRQDGGTDREIGRDRKTGKTIWLPVSD